MKNMIEAIRSLMVVLLAAWCCVIVGWMVATIALSPLALLLYGIYKVAQLFVK